MTSNNLFLRDDNCQSAPLHLAAGSDVGAQGAAAAAFPSPAAPAQSPPGPSYQRILPPRPMGPRSPDRAGSSRTQFLSIDPVIEHIEEASEPPSASTLPPGVLAEHRDADVDGDILPPSQGDISDPRRSRAQNVGFMEIDPPGYLYQSTPERVSIGAGVMPKLWFEELHPHKLYRLANLEILKPLKPPLPPIPAGAAPVTDGAAPGDAVSSTAASSPVEASQPPAPYTADDVWDALPGGRDNATQWYFCPECWGWLRVVPSEAQGNLPKITPMEDWPSTAPEDREVAKDQSMREMARLADLESSKAQIVKIMHQHHLHAFRTLIAPTTETRIPRVEPEGHQDHFSHLDPDMGPPPQEYTSFTSPHSTDPVLYISCSSRAWVFVDKGLVPGQLPPGLVRRFTREKLDNPRPDTSSINSANGAWNLVLT